MPPTLILPPRFTPDSNRMWKAAIDLGWNVERLASWRVPETLRDLEVVVYGEPLFAAVVSDALGVALLEPPFDWLTTLPAELLRRRVRFMWFEKARCEPAPAFIKPADDKCFAARVYASGEDLPDVSLVDVSTPVLVAEPVTWEVEYRCFVLDRKVATMSPYLRDGQLCQADDGSWPAPDSEHHEAKTFAEQLLTDQSVSLPPAVVVDIGYIDNAGWAVVEANPAWGSGLYGCDARLALQTIRHACVRQSEVSEAHRPWMPIRSAGQSS